MFNTCLICSHCANCTEDEEGHPTCKHEPGLDCSDSGEMKDWGFFLGECDCADFEGIEECEPADEPEEFYNGRFDYCPSVFDRI
ncbi:MAG: hypothetical protein IJT68_06320 [Lentisphaeria bacterium]|nr:hypothetical protein [Lentisphaeria bacterium]